MDFLFEYPVIPILALFAIGGVFIYQAKSYLDEKKRNQAPSIPKLNTAKLKDNPQEFMKKIALNEQAAGKPKKGKGIKIFLSLSIILLITVNMVGLIYFLGNKRTTYIPRASTSPTAVPTLFVQPTAEPTDIIDFGDSSLSPTVPALSPTLRLPSPTLPQASPTLLAYNQPQPSKTPTPSPTARPTVTPLTTQAVLPTNTPTPIFVVSPTNTPTLIPSPTQKPLPTPTGVDKGIPEAGLIQFSTVLLLLSVLFLTIGFAL